MQIEYIFLFNRMTKQKKHLILWSETKDVVLLRSEKKDTINPARSGTFSRKE